MPRFIVLAMVLSALAVAPASAQTAEDVNASLEAVLGDHAAYREAFEAIREAVAADDAEAVAQWIAYPFNVSIDGEDLSIEGPDGFVELYEGIVTPEVKQVVTGQKYEQLFVNAEGVMFGDGQMWLNGICREDACAEFDVRIIAIQSTAAK